MWYKKLFIPLQIFTNFQSFQSTSITCFLYILVIEGMMLSLMMQIKHFFSTFFVICTRYGDYETFLVKYGQRISESKRIKQILKNLLFTFFSKLIWIRLVHAIYRSSFDDFAVAILKNYLYNCFPNIYIMDEMYYVFLFI